MTNLDLTKAWDVKAKAPTMIAASVIAAGGLLYGHTQVGRIEASEKAIAALTAKATNDQALIIAQLNNLQVSVARMEGTLDQMHRTLGADLASENTALAEFRISIEDKKDN